MAIGALAGAGVGLANALIQGGNQQTANAINWRAVLEQQRANRKNERLLRATRRDVYGNELKYTPGLGWQYVLTPTTQKITNAQQAEELASLTRDAPRNRAAAERRDERSKMADEEFGRAFNDFKYRPKTSKRAEVADATQLLLNSRQRGLTEAANLLARQTMRQGGSANYASILKQAGDQFAGSLEDAMLRGKQIGRDSYERSEANALNRAASELGMLGSIADGTTTSPVASPQYNNDLTRRADNATSQLSQGITGGASRVASALQHAAAGFANSGPDLGPVAAALSRLSLPSRTTRVTRDETDRRNDPWYGLRTVRI